VLTCAAFALAGGATPGDTSAAGAGVHVPVLLYHRFGPSVADAMTVRTSTFRRQLEYMRREHVTVIPLRTLVSYLRGEGPAPPARAVCITADDGHMSVYHEMLPVVREYQVPVTLFVYPSAISNASYAMTWDQLVALRQTGLFDIQSHTYWHPRFDRERHRLAPAAFDAFVTRQFVAAQEVISARTGSDVQFLAWPFGIYDDDLIRRAEAAGYVAGFTLERRAATAHDPVLALPRFLVTDGDGERGLAALLGSLP
jgi:peptidoglycan/xylan/chitin deacetylase (PgdA/CDA1 family)